MKAELTFESGRAVQLWIPNILLWNPIGAGLTAAKINQTLRRQGKTARVRAKTVRMMFSVLRRAKRRGVIVAEIEAENRIKITV